MNAPHDIHEDMIDDLLGRADQYGDDIHEWDPTTEIPPPPGTVEEAWPHPTSLGTPVPPPFPVGVLPPWMDAMVDGVADELQAPRDLPAMLGIGMLAIIYGGRGHVRVRGAWRESLNLYTVTALPPSVGKSPALKFMFRPLQDWIDAEIERVAPDIRKAQQERRMIESDMNKAERAGERTQAAVLLDELEAVQVPRLPQLWTDDATPEAFVKRLHEYDGRMSILSTEGGVFQLMAGRYSDQMANLDPYLKAWSGDSITVDRVGRESFVIPRPATSIVLTVQPSVLQQVGENTDNRNRGLPARFMMSIPISNVGQRNLIDAPTLPDHVATEYEWRVGQLIRHAEQMTNVELTLAEPAQRGFLVWRQSLESRRAGDLAPLAEWTTKLESSTARLAGLLHLADDRPPHEPIGVEVMQRAIAVATYWIEHARIAHELWDADSATANARAIVDKMLADDVTETTLRDVMRSHRKRFATADQAVAALELLVDNCWMRSDGPCGEVRALRAGQRSPRLQLHPQCSNLWINPPHVAPVLHVPKDVIEISSSSLLDNAHGRRDSGT